MSPKTMAASARVPRSAAGADDFLEDTLTVRGTTIRTRVGHVRHADLRFFIDNPRVYSLLRADGCEPTQEEIESKLQDMEHVRQLVLDIKANGGLIDPLVVKDGTMEVIEGNSRLAAYRLLSRQNPVRWDAVKCVILPADVEDTLVTALLAQWHLKGKKEWPPYEQAGYLYRRHTIQGIGITELAAEVGLARGRVSQFVEAYTFMVARRDTRRERWSYYDEYTKSRKISKAREAHPELDDVVVDMIQSGDIPTAQDLRDKLPVICEGPPRVLAKFVRGTLGFEEAHDTAVAAGGDNGHFQRLAKFRKWLAQQDVQDALTDTEGSLRKQVVFEVERLQRLVTGLGRKLER